MTMMIQLQIIIPQQQLQRRIVEKHFEEKWLKFNSGTLFTSSNFILGNIEVQDYMVGVRGRQRSRSRMHDNMYKTEWICHNVMKGKRKLGENMAKIDAQ